MKVREIVALLKSWGVEHVIIAVPLHVAPSCKLMNLEPNVLNEKIEKYREVLKEHSKQNPEEFSIHNHPRFPDDRQDLFAGSQKEPFFWTEDGFNLNGDEAFNRYMYSLRSAIRNTIGGGRKKKGKKAKEEVVEEKPVVVEVEEAPVIEEIIPVQPDPGKGKAKVC